MAQKNKKIGRPFSPEPDKQAAPLPLPASRRRRRPFYWSAFLLRFCVLSFLLPCCCFSFPCIPPPPKSRVWLLPASSRDSQPSVVCLLFFQLLSNQWFLSSSFALPSICGSWSARLRSPSSPRPSFSTQKRHTRHPKVSLRSGIWGSSATPSLCSSQLPASHFPPWPGSAIFTSFRQPRQFSASLSFVWGILHFLFFVLPLNLPASLPFCLAASLPSLPTL